MKLSRGKRGFAFRMYPGRFATNIVQTGLQNSVQETDSVAQYNIKEPLSIQSGFEVSQGTAETGSLKQDSAASHNLIQYHTAYYNDYSMLYSTLFQTSVPAIHSHPLCVGVCWRSHCFL